MTHVGLLNQGLASWLHGESFICYRDSQQERILSLQLTSNQSLLLRSMFANVNSIAAYSQTMRLHGQMK